MPGIKDDRGGHMGTWQNNSALWWLIIFFPPPPPTRPVCKCFDLARRNVCLMRRATWFVLLLFLSSLFKLDGFAFCFAIWVQWSFHFVLTSVPLSIRLTNRLSTKTTWSWRKETSTLTPSSPERPTPTHTSLTSTLTMIISPHSRSERTPPMSPTSSLCFVSRFLTPCVGSSHTDTLRQLEHK